MCWTNEKLVVCIDLMRLVFTPLIAIRSFSRFKLTDKILTSDGGFLNWIFIASSGSLKTCRHVTLVNCVVVVDLHQGSRPCFLSEIAASNADLILNSMRIQNLRFPSFSHFISCKKSKKIFCDRTDGLSMATSYNQLLSCDG